MKNKQSRVVALTVAILMFSAGAAHAQTASTGPGQTYPTKPGRFLVGFAPGGGADITARIVAAKLSELWGQQLVVDNRTGAGGAIATDIVAKSSADGYSLLLCGIWSHGIGPSIYKKLPYDHYKDFAPVSMIGSSPMTLVVNPAVLVKSVSEFIAYTKANNGKIIIAYAGTGSSPHMALELFRLNTAINVVPVPYKGGGAAMAELLGGHVQAMFAVVATVATYVKSNRLRALAVASPKRNAQLPEVPTMRESGVPIDVGTWSGLCAPAATPKPILAKLNADLNTVLNAPDTQKRLANQAVEAAPSTPGEFAAFIKSETEK